jgi:hypothetical protein
MISIRGGEFQSDLGSAGDDSRKGFSNADEALEEGPKQLPA